MEHETRPVNLIHFHGLTLWVIDDEGIEYIQAKPLIELASIQLKSGLRTLLSDENVRLFGTKKLNDPVFNTKKDDASPKKQVYIRLDRARMYLARINTANMRAKNNNEAADRLIELQIEWAGVLHEYETKGEVNKKSRSDRLSVMMARLEKMENPTMKAILAREINEEFGIHIPIGNQKELNLG